MADIASLLQAVNFAVGAAEPKRTPIRWQSTMRERLNIPPLLMRINPQQVQFQQGKRIQKQDTQGGTTYFHFSNQNGQNNDVLTLQLSGTTGNIDPRSVRNQLLGVSIFNTNLSGVQIGTEQIPITTDRTGALDNLKAWVSFYQLTLEPILDPGTGRPNLVTMSYSSPIFRKPVDFTGFFMSVMQFPETATEPFQRQWSVPFTVVRTDPDLNELSDYLTRTLVAQL